MANILDYLDWRGDIPVTFDGFNEVDNLILAKLSFIDFSDIVPPPEAGSGLRLSEAADQYFEKHCEGMIDMGVLVPQQVPELLRRMAASRRFQDMCVNAYEEILDEAREEQFAALSVEIGDGTVYCAFRGTDDTLIGWKEDMNLGVMEEIPSQAQARSYLERVAKQYETLMLRVGGHSKGGNLAVYSAMYVSQPVQERIVQIYNNDGPGFHRDLTDTKEHQRIAPRILSVMPQSSVVGMILSHERNAEVVSSAATGIAQHNGFTWEVRGRKFVHLDDFSREGKRTEETLDQWTKALNDSQRKLFIGALYEVLSGTGARTLRDLNDEKIKNAGAMLKTYRSLDEDTRRALTGALGLLMRLSAKGIAKDMQESQEKRLDELREKADEMRRKLFDQE